jgi:hypothetical protein
LPELDRGFCFVTPEKKKRSKLLDWYTVTSETLRGWGFALTVVILGVIGFFGYRILNEAVLEREVARVIQESEDLLRTVRDEGAINSYREEYFVARNHLEEAKRNQAGKDFKEAFRSAERSRSLLASILSTLSVRGPEGEAMFIAVQGGVEFRRGDRGSWQSARSRVALNAGDYVKTSRGGSAEIMTVDGTLYTVRPDTVLLIGRIRPGPGAVGQRTVQLESGWVDLGTSQNPSRISTPQAETRVQLDSTAAISHDPEKDESKFSAYTGSLTVASNDGTSREVGAMQSVTQSGAKLSAPARLPDPPVPVLPEDDYEAFLAAENEILLQWGEVDGADHYALQVARNRFFVQNVISVDNRKETTAKIGLQGTGTFVWRVSAVDGSGVQGPWSELRRFRVTTGKTLEEASSEDTATASASDTP